MQIFGRSVGGGLAAGNACVVKPAEDACLSLLRIAELAAGAGLPEGALNIVPGLGQEAGAALAAHRGIDHISFTGSPATGSAVAQAAAAHHHPVTLELGGKSPQIVFADADIEEALPVLTNAVVQNAGQTCSAGSRLLVERPLYEKLLDKLGARFAALRVGPYQMDLDCGPLIRASQLDRVKGFLAGAVADGIPTVAAGKLAPEAPAGGYYQVPTLLRDVPVDHRLAQEEVFGPVLAAMPFDDEADAIAMANATRVRPGRGCLDARRRPAAAHGPRAAQRPGIHQQLRRRWRGGTAIRRREVQRLRAGKGLRGLARIHHAKDGCHQAWLNASTRWEISV